MMRKVIFLFIGICLSISAQDSFAHTPASIRVQKDMANNQLHISVMHRIPKSRRTVHYVEKIEVPVDDQEPIVEEFTSQRDRRRQRAIVTVPGLGSSEKIKITAYATTGDPIEKEFSVQEIPDYNP